MQYQGNLWETYSIGLWKSSPEYVVVTLKKKTKKTMKISTSEETLMLWVFLYWLHLLHCYFEKNIIWKFVAMFFFCNTNYVALCISGGWIWICSCQPPMAWRVIWMPEYLPAEWMNGAFCPEFTLVFDDVGAGYLTFAEESPQEKIQECWGWWGGAPDLSQWRHAKSKMYRIFL